MLDTVISMKYMLAGYTIILSVLAIYLISLFVRWKNLHRDLKTLNEIEIKI
jgi:hypothetical protein